MNIKQHYIVAGNPRSGSTLLCDLLETNGLGCPKEHFKSSEPILPFSRALATGESTEVFARSLFAHQSNDIFGTKIMWTWLEAMSANAEMTSADGFDLIASLFPRCKYIFITRMDRLGQAISLLRAADTNQWTAIKGAPSESFNRWSEGITFHRIHGAIVTLALYDLYWRRWFMKNNTIPLEIRYEDLTKDPETVITKVGKFLVGSDFRFKSFATKLMIQRDERSAEIAKQYLAAANRS